MCVGELLNISMSSLYILCMNVGMQAYRIFPSWTVVDHLQFWPPPSCWVLRWNLSKEYRAVAVEHSSTLHDFWDLSSMYYHPQSEF